MKNGNEIFATSMGVVPAARQQDIGRYILIRTPCPVRVGQHITATTASKRSCTGTIVEIQHGIVTIDTMMMAV